MITTYDEARRTLTEVILDVEADMGPDAVEAAYADLVRTVAADCTDEVAEEFMRREGVT